MKTSQLFIRNIFNTKNKSMAFLRSWFYKETIDKRLPNITLKSFKEVIEQNKRLETSNTAEEHE